GRSACAGAWTRTHCGSRSWTTARDCPARTTCSSRSSRRSPAEPASASCSRARSPRRTTARWCSRTVTTAVHAWRGWNWPGTRRREAAKLEAGKQTWSDEMRWISALVLCLAAALARGDDTNVVESERGDVTVHPIEHASFVLEAGGKRIAFDPV